VGKSGFVQRMAVELFAKSVVPDLTLFGSYKAFDVGSDCGAGWCVQVAEELERVGSETNASDSQMEVAVNLLVKSADRWFFMDHGGRMDMVARMLAAAGELLRYVSGGEECPVERAAIEQGDVPIENCGLPGKVVDALMAASTMECPLTTAREVLRNLDATKVIGVGPAVAKQIKAACDAAIGEGDPVGGGGDSDPPEGDLAGGDGGSA